jgi:hypothetical protein
VNSILLAFLEFFYYYLLEFEDSLSLSECFSVEISDRPPRLSLLCIDMVYNFIFLRAKKECSTDVVVDGIVTVNL